MITHVYRLLYDSLLEVIESRGHIPLVDGGGHTAFEQANDTDLHDLISSMWPVERHGSGRGEEGEKSSVAFEGESDA